ncbi:Uncharacterized protein OBRU01_10868 [Operophtera brumata]|uniref:C2 DOCK-type domain-containing protein n=1 Tax=Operophtera brumata TaxID=104452 RepID=A0A0L7LD90_OPEBR|nr:Uncharacterized protein OBRU01_10868 [Operophtera brumata]
MSSGCERHIIRSRVTNTNWKGQLLPAALCARKLGLELVPRRGAEAVDPEDISLVELYRDHVESAERAAAVSSSFNSGTLTNNSTNAPTATTTVQSHNLMCSMRDFGHTAGGDEAELLLWLHDARRAQPLSERFRVRIARDGFSNYVDRLHANSTLFADLSTTDLTRELWLVAWVIRVGRWAGACSSGSGTGERRGPVARRPLGAGVLPLAEFLRQPGQTPAERDISEAVSSGATITAKRGFPDVIMPGDVRNDLYLTLEKAEFERGGKSTAKNVLATVNVHDNTGQVISECVWGASGTGATSYESVVLYHNNSPAWGEQLRLTVPLETFTHAHVRIEFRHCSTRDKNERKLFGFAFARLMEASGATLRDGAHELYVYKCDDPSNTPHSGTVFLVLISICSLLDESRFQHFRPVLDHCAEWAAGAEGQEPIRKCLRSLGAVFRLAVRSRRLFARATGGQYEDSFRRDRN